MPFRLPLLLITLFVGASFESRKIDASGSSFGSVKEAILSLAGELELPAMQGCETDFPKHRCLCLRLCGVVDMQHGLEQTVAKLVAEKQRTKAAALALFRDEPKLAYTALKSNEPAQAHNLLAMAIAGAGKGPPDRDWQEMCADIARELTDPYARAILAFVSKGDWNTVIEETTLPLKYRMEVALRWLPDAALTKYINQTTAEVICQGDIEGVVLTGLGYFAMELFQSYINKFNDVQTPVLAMSRTVPRFIDDDRVKVQFEAWCQTYRMQINSWKLQLDRVKFDVGSRKLAVTWGGRRLLPAPPQQISLACTYCTRPLAQQQASSSSLYSYSTAIADETVVHPASRSPLGSIAMSGTVCPKCGRHMPRCGVCTLWLGSPDPMSRAGAAANAAPENRDRKPSEMEIMRRFAVFCVNCNHGFHAHHAREWFQRHKVCPVAECDCICDR